jgi:hypothetical protein
MCLDNIEEICAAVEDAKKAKAQLQAFEDSVAEHDGGSGFAWFEMKLTHSECRLIFTNRLTAAEQALKDLGFRGPLAKAAPADSAETTRVLNAR